MYANNYAEYSEESHLFLKHMAVPPGVYGKCFRFQ